MSYSSYHFIRNKKRPAVIYFEQLQVTSSILTNNKGGNGFMASLPKPYGTTASLEFDNVKSSSIIFRQFFIIMQHLIFFFYIRHKFTAVYRLKIHINSFIFNKYTVFPTISNISLSIYCYLVVSKITFIIILLSIFSKLKSVSYYKNIIIIFSLAACTFYLAFSIT